MNQILVIQANNQERLDFWRKKQVTILSAFDDKFNFDNFKILFVHSGDVGGRKQEIKSLIEKHSALHIIYYSGYSQKLIMGVKDGRILSELSFTNIERGFDEFVELALSADANIKSLVEKIFLEIDYDLEDLLSSVYEAPTPDTVTDSKEKLRNYLKEKYPDA